MVKIRKALEKDAKEYAILLNTSWKDTYGEYISLEHIDNEFNIEKRTKNFPKYIKSNDYEVYMIEHDDMIVGLVELGMPEDNYKENMEGLGEIRSLHIKKEYTHQGIGKQAVTFAANRLKELGYDRVCVWVKKKNTNAINFYDIMGFKETEFACNETVDGAPSFVMEKDL